MTPLLDQILDFLIRNRIRATYGAVGTVIGLPAQSVGKALGRRCPRASWVVRTRDGEPSGYTTQEKDPNLNPTTDIIRTGADLIFRLQRKE